jgi:hypothetical protein
VDVNAPRRPLLARLRSAARFVPVHRVLHSVELTVLVLLAALADVLTDGRATGWLLVTLLVGAGIAVTGHLVAILTSGRLS